MDFFQNSCIDLLFSQLCKLESAFNLVLKLPLVAKALDLIQTKIDSLVSGYGLRKSSQYSQTFLEGKWKQECIPVGCVRAAHWPYAGVCFWGGCLLRGCVCSRGCLLWGGSAPGVSALGGVCSGKVCLLSGGGCLLLGGVSSNGGVCSRGCLLHGRCVSALGGVCSQGGVVS